MENITVVGIKEINQKIAKMERSLEDISKSLELIAKIMNRQVPKPMNWADTPPKRTEDEDDLR